MATNADNKPSHNDHVNPHNSHGKAETAFEVRAATARPRWIPTVEYTVQNILISLGTLISSWFSLFLTLCVVLPLACLRAVFFSKDAIHSQPPPSMKRGKVVLIMGASRGIGLEVLKQYCPEPGTTVIAVSKNADIMRNALVQLGDTPATLQMETIDLAGHSKSIASAITELDDRYGPISHLYAISGISNHLKDSQSWGLDVTEQMIKVNVSGTVAMVLAMYERMKKRQYGKICIVGSTAGLYSPANMISYASTKAFLNTFSTSLRVLASGSNIDVVTVEPGFIDTRMTRKMRGQDSSAPAMEFEAADELARKMKLAVERGGVGVVSWPVRQSVVMFALQAVNPICQEIGQFVSMKQQVAGKKIT